MARLWEEGFRNALSYGDLSGNDEYRSKRESFAAIEGTLGQGVWRAQWDEYRMLGWELRDMEAESRREMERLYNAMLRRFAGVASIVPPIESALKAMLPWDYRVSRAVNLLQKWRWFDHWRLLPRDWAEGGRSRSSDSMLSVPSSIAR